MAPLTSRADLVSWSSKLGCYESAMFRRMLCRVGYASPVDRRAQIRGNPCTWLDTSGVDCASFGTKRSRSLGLGCLLLHRRQALGHESWRTPGLLDVSRLNIS